MPENKGPDFAPLVKAYATRALERGVPSLFADLKAAQAGAAAADKRNVVGEVVEGLRETLERTGTLDGEAGAFSPLPPFWLALRARRSPSPRPLD